MKASERKKFQRHFAKENINHYFKLLEDEFKPEFNIDYIRDIKRLSEGFNIRLKREDKLKFCKKCNIYWNVNTREIRLNPTLKCKEYICKNCSYVKRFKY